MKDKQKVSINKFTMMTQMPVNKLICKMAVPTIITMLVSAVYNMADTYFVGKIGTSATGAVGVVFSFMAIIQACGFFLRPRIGKLYVTQARRAKDRRGVRNGVNGIFFVVCRRSYNRRFGADIHFAPVKAARFNRYHFAVYKAVSFLHSLRNAVYDEFACA